jgi:hypothetical protein
MLRKLAETIPEAVATESARIQAIFRRANPKSPEESIGFRMFSKLIGRVFKEF